MESKLQPSRSRSGNLISCCLISLHFLCDFLQTFTVILINLLINMLINELSNDDHVNFTQATMKTIPCTSGRPRVICATNVNGQTCDGDSGGAVVGQSENYIT